MFICEDCGRLYERVGCHMEEHGECRSDDCACGGVLVEAKECPVCGEYISKRGVGICDNCLDEEMTVENAICIGKNYRESVKLNGFYLSIMTRDQIEMIIENWVEQHVLDKSAEVKEYIMEDLSSLFYAKANERGKRK